MSSENDFSVRVDFERILQTISASIYDNQYAFLRENVQNAIDAIRIQAARESVSPDDPRYRIDVEILGNVCSITDNGIGMTKDELRNNFWTMGASGKTTAEAKAAGCVGIFGIGGFANFGVCDTLEVISRTDACQTAHNTSLSRSAFHVDRFTLPTVQYRESSELTARGTIVRGTAKTPFDANGLVGYLRQFVRFAREPVYVQGRLISQDETERPGGTHRPLAESLIASDANIEVAVQLFADEGHNLSVKILGLKVGGQTTPCAGYVRLVHGQLEVYKRGFRICSVGISSRIGISGRFDADIVVPTAGRDTLEARSITFLTQLFRLVERAAWPYILDDPDLLTNHTRLLSDFVNAGLLEKLATLPVNTLDKRQFTLEQLRKLSEEGRRIFFTQSGRGGSAAEVLQARGHVIVATSSDHQRRLAEMQYLRTYCKAEEFDNLIERLEVYSELDSFERALLAELEVAIRKLFNPLPFRFSPGKLTLDAPIYWSSKKEGGATVVLVDTRHGEFQKLRPLGFSPLFWSMMEAFCREYLGDTLKRQSPKFFGSGALDLDAYCKSHAELWELLSTDIEISRIQAASGVAPAIARHVGRIDVVRSADVERITISSTSGVVTNQPEETKTPVATTEAKTSPKLLHVIDETGRTGLQGFFLRIPESATAAFGELIRTFPAFAVVWFANRITWQGSDLKTTAFLFEITLDRLIGAGATAEVANGLIELESNKIQTYKDQTYFHVPPSIQDYLVPKQGEAIKIEVRHELIDLGHPRSWTSRQAGTST